MGIEPTEPVYADPTGFEDQRPRPQAAESQDDASPNTPTLGRDLGRTTPSLIRLVRGRVPEDRVALARELLDQADVVDPLIAAARRLLEPPEMEGTAGGIAGGAAG